MSPLRRRLMFGIPLAVVAVGGLGFWDILHRMQDDQYDPHALPSPLIGHRPPGFSLPGPGLPSIGGAQGFSSADLAAPKTPMLVNWFASWCQPCQEEAAMLGKLAAAGLTIWGIAYQDAAGQLAGYLRQNGDPYARLAADITGNTAINWGVYGVPETYLIDRAGIVRWRWAGALTDVVVRRQLDPLLAQYA